jgi:hypothetical protein
MTPYANATSGQKARAEVTKMLQVFGCESVGFMDDFAEHSVMLAFKHRGRPVQLRASAKGWAALYLKENPWSHQRRSTQQQWEKAALDQGLIAINSILRDWVKGQITAVECGMLSFESVFMPYLLLENGETLIDRISTMKLLPAAQTLGA